MLKTYTSLAKESNFLLLWTSQLFSQITVHMLNFIILINLFSLTGSTIATSLLWVSFSIPAVIFGPFVAVLVDVYSRKKLLVITNLAQAALIFLVSFSNPDTPYPFYVVAFLYSLINQFYMPTEAASVPSLVKKENLPAANALFFLTQQIAVVLGFGLAGPINANFGFQRALLVGALFMAIAFFAVWKIKGLSMPKEALAKFEGKITSFFQSIYEGYQFIKQRKTVLFPFLLLLGLQTVLAVIMVNVPEIAVTVFKIDINLSGILIVVPAAFGAMLGAAYFPYKLRQGLRKITLVRKSLLIGTISLLVLSLFVYDKFAIYKLLIALTAVLLAGFAYVGILVPSQTFLQESTPDGKLGRVFGNFWFIATAINMVPVIFSGAITDLFGIRSLLLLMALIGGAVYLFSKSKTYNYAEAK